MSEKQTLPALVVEVSGLVKTSNLDAYRDTALSLIAEIPETLTTDEEFAQAETDSKWCGEIRTQLKAARTAIIEQTGDISALLSLIDEIDEAAKAKESTLTRSIQGQKEALKDKIVKGASLKFQEHVRAYNQDLPRGCEIFCPTPSVFKDAMKGKRTIKGCREAVQAVYEEELEKASGIYLDTLANWQALEGKEHLMRDFASHCRKSPEDFLEILASREKEEALRLENERLKQEAEIKAKQQEISESIETKRAEREQAAAQAIITEVAAETVKPPVAPTPEPVRTVSAPVASSAAQEAAASISAFMRYRDFGDDRWAVKAILVDYEKFKAQRPKQEAAA